MNKIDKYLDKLLPKERSSILEIMAKIEGGDTDNLDIKKLKGYNNYYRARVGKTRILFFFDTNGHPRLDKIVRRDDNTYN